MKHVILKQKEKLYFSIAEMLRFNNKSILLIENEYF